MKPLHSKFKQGGAAGAIALVLIFLARQFDLELDAETAGAFAYLITLVGVYRGNGEAE